MCGISAVFRYREGARVEDVELERIQQWMVCRGPDGAGIWKSEDNRVALTQRRLAIIDLSERGAQPMRSNAAPNVLTFNGEIYNYKALRKSLEAKGFRFDSDSDSEVILHLYADKGVAMLDDLHGMFALALWDGTRRGLLLARDPFGIKPLYYADDGRCLRAASEVKALLAGGNVDTSPDPAGHAGFFLWGHVPEPFTLHRGIRALPAGSTLWLPDGGKPAVARYADVTSMLRDAGRAPVRISQSEANEALRAAFEESVTRHLVADVDVGVFLSSGIDSTTMAAVARHLGGRLRTVTLGFAEYRGTANDETLLAEAVARQYDAQHETVWVRQEDFAAERDRLLDRMDQPTIDGVNSYFVSRAAKATGLKVAMSGAGGDELFAGYSTFAKLPRIVNATGWIPGARVFGRALRLLSAPIVSRFSSPKYASLLEYGGRWGSGYMLTRSLYLPWELPALIGEDMAFAGLEALNTEENLEATVAGLSDDRARVSALEASWYMRNQLLRDTDWASMSHSLEVRVPFVDWTFWKAVAPLIASRGVTIDKSALSMVPRKSLPMEVRARPKTGFQIPVREWLLRDVHPRYAGRGLRGWARLVYDRATRRPTD